MRWFVHRNSCLDSLSKNRKNVLYSPFQCSPFLCSLFWRSLVQCSLFQAFAVLDVDVLFVRKIYFRLLPIIYFSLSIKRLVFNLKSWGKKHPFIKTTLMFTIQIHKQFEYVFSNECTSKKNYSIEYAIDSIVCGDGWFRIDQFSSTRYYEL